MKKNLKILMSLIFYPRGGSSQVVRYLSRALRDLGHDVHILTGSLRDGNDQHEAEVFYEDLPVSVADYTEAWHGFERGENPISDEYDVPFHPSYEDKLGVPDRIFLQVTRREYSGLLRCWTKLFSDVRETYRPDIVHLHHLNYMHIAAQGVFPSTPKATQLHGTELKMLEMMDAHENLKNEERESHSFWREILADAMSSMDFSFAISPDIKDRGTARFSLDEAQITTIPNGVDISLFHPLRWGEGEKFDFLRSILVENPQGWDETGVVGSVRYSDEDLERLRFRDGRLKPLAMFVGRFLDFKRVSLLLRAMEKVNRMFHEDADWPPVNLLIWGGMPGEYEGVHPFTLTKELDIPNVLFAGWLPHGLLSQGLNLADVFVAPSYFEPFGQVFLEAMATGVPVIGTRSGGPLSFVVDSGPRTNGWLCGVDDVDSLARTLYEALSHVRERKRRGDNALSLATSTYSWKGIAEIYLGEYERLAENRGLGMTKS